MQSNLYVLPAYGQAITLDDQGTYCVLNRQTGNVQSIVRLAYENDHWYFYQIQQQIETGEYYWSILGDSSHYLLQSLTSEAITHHFNKPEYAEPKGAWQVLSNGKYGFGKFTPLDNDAEEAYAILMFAEDGELRSVIKLHGISMEDEASMPLAANHA